MLLQREGKLIFRYDAEEVWIEPWGENALRVRATKASIMPTEDWALQMPIFSASSDILIEKLRGKIENGNLKATISAMGKLMMFNQKGDIILEEYMRNRKDHMDPKASALDVEARELKPLPGGDYHLTMRLESVSPKEKIYGMGQYQQPYLNLKGLDIEMAHRNSQASVPFMLSSLGYGLLWNNPSIGRAVLGKNIMTFEALSTKALDYWIVVGDTPAEIEQAYAGATGTVPMMPEYGLGFWQCKLRYQTQEELLSIAREYKKRELPIDVIVIDFFHWPKQGDWRFDPTYWPDPDTMISELKEMKIELMVSVWPYVDTRSENYEEMLESGYLVRTERGVRHSMTFQGNTIPFDATNPEARKYVWRAIDKNYFSKGIKLFWLDEAEPECNVYDFDNYRYHLGSVLQIGNVYPVEYAKTFYQGQEAAGQQNIVNLLRCAWAGSQKYGALVWSGDIASSWSSFRNQLAAGLNMGIAGIPWWTTDIGGFHGGNPDDPEFRELMIRWFQWATFCPVMRLHGDREPKMPQHGTTGGAECTSGAANEVWSYGEEIYEICKKYMRFRETLRDYTRSLMQGAHLRGTPVIRTCFYVFPEDEGCWSEDIEDQYMYGDQYLCAPVLERSQKMRNVYLPKGATWKQLEISEDGTEEEVGELFDGGNAVDVDCPLHLMPVFVRH
jgi:alpha-D-xyloside xylohydrolase